MNDAAFRVFMARVDALWPGMLPAWSEESIRFVYERIRGFTQVSAELALTRLATRPGRKWRPDPGDLVAIVEDLGERDPQMLPALPEPDPGSPKPWAQVSESIHGRYVPLVDHVQQIRGVDA